MFDETSRRDSSRTHDFDLPRVFSVRRRVLRVLDSLFSGFSSSLKATDGPTDGRLSRSNENLIRYRCEQTKDQPKGWTSWEGKEEKRRESKRQVHGITRFRLRGMGERDRSCSQPRNNVGGLWFFIRARSHNGERE